MAALPVPIGAVGVGELEQVAQESPQPAWVQPPGCLDQDRFGLDGDVFGQGVGAGGEHLGVGNRDFAVGQSLSCGGQRTPEQGPGGPDRAGRGPSAQVEAVPQPGGGRADLLVGFSPGDAAAVDPGQFLEPQAVQAIDQPPQRQDPLGPDTITSRSRSWVASRSRAAVSPARSSRCPGGGGPGGWFEWVFESMAATYQAPHQRQAPTTRLWTSSCRDLIGPTSNGEAGFTVFT
jgi:hypothetical protein